jgi:pyrroline-5-carboxylate reductase
MATTFIGGGNMATALIGGMLARGAGAGEFRVVEPSAEARRRMSEHYAGGCACSANARPMPSRGTHLVVLAVKPQQMRDAARALAPHLPGDAGPVVLSIAAGIRLAISAAG